MKWGCDMVGEKYLMKRLKRGEEAALRVLIGRYGAYVGYISLKIFADKLSAGKIRKKLFLMYFFLCGRTVSRLTPKILIL